VSSINRALGADLNRVPMAGGRMVKELAQSIERMSGFVEARARQGFFGRAAETFTGKLQNHVNRSLVSNQREMARKLDELRANGISVDVSIARVSDHLRQVQTEVEHEIRIGSRSAGDLADLGLLTSQLAGLVDVCQERIGAQELAFAAHARTLRSHNELLWACAAVLRGQDAVVRGHETILSAHQVLLQDHEVLLQNHERRLNAWEFRSMVQDFRQAGDDAVEKAIGRWQDGITYTGLPWAVRVVLLAQEVANGPAGAYELLAPISVEAGSPNPTGLAGDPRRYQDMLADRILRLSTPGDKWEGLRDLVGLLGALVAEVSSVEDRELVSEVLGVGLVSDLAPLHRGPLSATVALALDEATRPGPLDGRTLHAVIRRGCGGVYLPSKFTARAFVKQVVDEQAASALAERHRLWVQGTPPPATL
jgi:hypothetical protein